MCKNIYISVVSFFCEDSLICNVINFCENIFAVLSRDFIKKFFL